MRLIDADAKALAQRINNNFGAVTRFIIKSILKDAPTIEAESVKHGRWEYNPDDVYWGSSLKRKRCSVCGTTAHFDRERHKFVLTDYCPHCGAKMDLEEEG